MQSTADELYKTRPLAPSLNEQIHFIILHEYNFPLEPNYRTTESFLACRVGTVLNHT
jgi:hypothetical protein